MIKISKRLESISSLIPINASIIDVGCDHALLDIYLIENKIVKKAIASDINKNALNNAVENIKKYQFENLIQSRLGDGLDTLTVDDNIDTIVISGLGTNTIIDILNNNKSKLDSINTMVISSNTKLPLLRKELSKLNYLIADEVIVEDNKKYYIIIKFIKGTKKYNCKELYFGPVLLEKKDLPFKEYFQNELSKLKDNLNKIPKDNNIERKNIEKEIRLYKDII